MPSKKPAAKNKSTRISGAKGAPTKARKGASPARPARTAAPARPTRAGKPSKPSKPSSHASQAAVAARRRRHGASTKSRTAETVKQKSAVAEKRLADKPVGRLPATEVPARPTPVAVDSPQAASPPAPSAVRGTPVVATAVSRGTLPPSAAEAQTDAEDTDEGSSLLAGPRNVKPYIAKRGEQYMNREQLEHFRQILLNWKRDLMEEVDRTVTHMKDEAANFPDPNDRATQEEEFSLELRTRDRERKLIRKIDEALKRIEDGTYGYCLETGEEIGIKRLEARPVATLSIEAQERRERRERQYGERDDRYR